MTCYACRKRGHYAGQCPFSMLQYQDEGGECFSNNSRVTFGFLQLSNRYSMVQSENRYIGICKNWVLLDSQSNFDIFCNSNFLTNIRFEEGELLHIHSYGGHLTTNMKGNIKNYGSVWYSPKSLANILALCNVRRKYEVKFHTKPDKEHVVIEVIKLDGTTMKFLEYDIDLYVHDVTQSEDKYIMCKLNQVNPCFFINTVDNNNIHFTKRDIEQGKKARELYACIDRPSMQTYIRYLDNNLIRDCPITASDVHYANKIYGTDLGSLKGKMVRKQPNSVPTPIIMPLPASIQTLHYVRIYSF